MKTVLAFTVFECLLFINCLQQFSLAAPTLQANEDVAAVSSNVQRRDAEYRNSLFSVYSCRVVKAVDAVVDKIQVG